VGEHSAAGNGKVEELLGRFGIGRTLPVVNSWMTAYSSTTLLDDTPFVAPAPMLPVIRAVVNDSSPREAIQVVGSVR
jgi:hypothetical protein